MKLEEYVERYKGAQTLLRYAQLTLEKMPPDSVDIEIYGGQKMRVDPRFLAENIRKHLAGEEE